VDTHTRPSLAQDYLTNLDTGLRIGGKSLPASDGRLIEVLDPANGNVVASVADGTVEDARRAVDAAAVAAAQWRKTAPRERGEILRRAFELIVERADVLAHLVVTENGKAIADARGEIIYAAEFFRWYSEEAVRITGTIQRAPAGANNILVTHQPIGIAVLITPWNFPAAMATRKVGPALAAGCTVVLKPASETPLTALAIADILAEAGVPAGVVNVLPSSRSGAVVAAMLDDDRVRKLSFTGSTSVGSLLMKQAADKVISTAMELGGNAPFIVFDDADLTAAVDGAMVAKMRNGGEACTAANRFYVQRGVAEEFTEALAKRMAALVIGPGDLPETQLGPLVNAASRDKVAELVGTAVQQGARIVVGGSVPDGAGFFYPATVLADVPSTSWICQEEIFGPVAPVVTFDDEQEAVALANDTPYGLVSYVYTRDLARGLRVSEALESGMVGLNRAMVSDPAAPFGGVKASGVGREGGHEGVLDYTESKYIAVDW
jgi:succinate-semialdehyde dehydrogenase/glutarate-semialdehyde dehydrogenase